MKRAVTNVHLMLGGMEWALLLECDHPAQRRVKFRRGPMGQREQDPPPKWVRCDRCRKDAKSTDEEKRHESQG